MSLPRKIGNWYALAVNTGQERQVRQRILDRLERAKVPTAQLTIVAPEEEVVFTGPDGQRKQRTRMAMPGYLLIHTRRLDEKALAMIGRVRGVLEFLGPEGAPTPLRHNEIEQLLGDAGGPARSVADPGFKPGDLVGITNGPLAGFEGKVMAVNESRGTAQVELEIFGRATPAEVELRHLRKR